MPAIAISNTDAIGESSTSKLGNLQLKTVPCRGEWPSGSASSTSLDVVEHGCVWSEIGWATFQMKDKNSSLRRPSEGTIN